MICPLAIAGLTFAFQGRWLGPEPPGWSGRVLGFLFLAHVVACLVAAIRPPRPAREARYWLAVGVILLDFWLTVSLMMAAMMAAAPEPQSQTNATRSIPTPPATEP